MLVDYKTIEVKTKFVDKGIKYNDLSDEEKEEYEETFIDSDGMLPDTINSSAINNWVFNKDTIKKMINELMTKGLRVDCNSKIGKTIIFAENHNHAEAIFEVFNKEYPELKSFVQVIDNKIKYSQSLIDEFSDPDKMPQIAISVDMLDTGIDIPEILNLVFFKKVYSKSKFHQMIGRGTRLCPGLIDGNDKEYFLIFDFCSNFEFFRLGNKSVDSNIQGTLQSNITKVRIEMIYKLQEPAFADEIYVNLREQLVKDLVEDIQKIDMESFRAKQHFKALDEFINDYRYKYLDYQDVLTIKNEIAPLIEASDDKYYVSYFDYLMYIIELAYLNNNSATKQVNTVIKLARNLSNVPNIVDIQRKQELLDNIANTEYVKKGDIPVLEHIRKELRTLMQYIQITSMKPKYIDFEDEIENIQTTEGLQLSTNSIDDYKKRFESYLRDCQNDPTLLKIKNNEILTQSDIENLDRIVIEILGSKEVYEQSYEGKPLVTLIRSINGLDMNTAKKLFSEFLDETVYNANQIYFVNQIIEYIVENGFIDDMTVLQSAPFNAMGSFGDLFGNNQNAFKRIRDVINNINERGGLKAA